MKKFYVITPTTTFLLCLLFPITAMAESANYHGEISTAHNSAFFKKVQNKNINRLVISSEGGDVEAGIELGLWVFKKKLTLEIKDKCFSACANYVFTAAARKIIRSGAVVAWHGNYHHLFHTGLWRDDIPIRMQRTGENESTAEQKVLEQVRHLVKLEKKFFAKINVDQYLCWIGKMPPYSARNYYFLSTTDMVRFGVRHVEAPAEYPKTDTSKFNISLKFIHLKD